MLKHHSLQLQTPQISKSPASRWHSGRAFRRFFAAAFLVLQAAWLAAPAHAQSSDDLQNVRINLLKNTVQLKWDFTGSGGYFRYHLATNAGHVLTEGGNSGEIISNGNAARSVTYGGRIYNRGAYRIKMRHCFPHMCHPWTPALAFTGGTPHAPPVVNLTRQENGLDVWWIHPGNYRNNIPTGFNVRVARSGIGENLSRKTAFTVYTESKYVGLTESEHGIVVPALYHIQVQAVNAHGVGQWSPIMPEYTGIGFASAPRDLRVTTGAGVLGDGKLQVNWSAPARFGDHGENHKYKVRWKRADEEKYLDPNQSFVDKNTFSHTIGGLEIGVRYDVRVHTVNPSGNGEAVRATATPLNSDAALKALFVSPGEIYPPVQGGTEEYGTTISNATTSLQITPAAADSNASVSVNGVALSNGSVTVNNLAVGENTVTIAVTAQSLLVTKEYTLSVTRLPALLELDIDSSDGDIALTPAFANLTQTYTAELHSAIDEVTVTLNLGNGTTAALNIAGNETAAAISDGIPFSVAMGAPGTDTVLNIYVSENEFDSLWRITLVRPVPKNTNARLASLTVADDNDNPLTLVKIGAPNAPGFSPAHTQYRVAGVDFAVKQLIITPVAEDIANARVVFHQEYVTGTSFMPALAVGANLIIFHVVAENGDSMAYLLTVVRKPAAATLADLAPSTGTFDTAFQPEETEYRITVGNTDAGIALTPTATDGDAQIHIGGVEVVSGGASLPQLLEIGENRIEIVVTAADGVFTKTYAVTVIRPKSDVVTLSNLAPSVGALDPSFRPGNTAYRITVHNTVRSIKLTPTATDGDAQIRVAGAAVAVGNTSLPQPLQVGANSIEVMVTAADGVAAKTYIVTVIRLTSDAATLGNLVPSLGALNPSFRSDNTVYSIAVDNPITAITLTPTATHSGAQIRIGGVEVTGGSASPPQSLEVGLNPIEVVVVVADSVATKIYTVTVIRADEFDLDVDNSGAVTAADATMIYRYLVNDARGSALVAGQSNADPADVAAKIKIGVDTEVLNVDGVKPILINVVDATLIVRYIARQRGSQLIAGFDGLDAAAVEARIQMLLPNYTGDVAMLDNLAPSAGRLKPSFAADSTTYRIFVENAVSGITLTPTAIDSNAQIRIAGALVADDSASPTQPLKVGANLIAVVVTAADGVATQTYTVTVTRTEKFDLDVDNSGSANVFDSILIARYIEGTFGGAALVAGIPGNLAFATIEAKIKIGMDTEVLNVDGVEPVVIDARDAILIARYLTGRRGPSLVVDYDGLDWAEVERRVQKLKP